MGWASGSELAETFIRKLKATPGMDYEHRHKAYLAFIPAMFDADWDCEDEVSGLDKAFDDAMEEVCASSGRYVDE